ncbi:hypothetical protein HZZ13_19380 [Bradyrhizobium sp. CNPSo 4010]|uniref:Uncharacterized protein n=1 Tax=Bradyrhizobium agreste TaxID=2751811 RepID=A0ABS0PRX0_9BRAD|nr:hypothetical protein [Bradyrhizobium agreste]MBH5399933.1 hypothetical protein [Bradyrhizobium agreste]
MKSTSLQKTLDLQKGLFLIRYDSAEDAAQPPKVSLSVDPQSSGSVEFLLPPEVEEPVLWSPGANVVVRLSAPARLQVELSPRSAGGSLGARIQSAQLSTDPLGLAALDEAPPDFAGLRLIGHLAGRGDTLVGLGEWLGGPMAPTRIEGVGIDWAERPQNFGVRHSVRVGGPGEPKTTEFVEAGGYSGTRGRALPLVGATFEVFGSAAQHYEITADAIFLGSPQMKVTGQRVVVSGPTGREPLVGLRLQIASTRAVQSRPDRSVSSGPAVSAPAAIAAEAAPKNPVRGGSGRVRVFRSRAGVKG